MCVLNKERQNTDWAWGRKQLTVIKQSKSNLIKTSSTHVWSEGLYYSCDNKGTYEMVHNSSVG